MGASPRKPTHKRASSNRRRAIGLPWNKPAAHQSLRETGIALIGKIPWGTHMCLFCETKADVLEAATWYFRAARDQHELCVWVVSEPLRVADAVEHLRSALPEFEERSRAGLFVVVSDEDWYFTAGRFDWPKTLSRWERIVADAGERGLGGIRAFSNPWWRRARKWRDMAEFERMLEQTIVRWPMIMLCGYTTEKSQTQDVFDVALNHQCAIALRTGVWEFLEVPHNDEARHELDHFNHDLDALPQRVRHRLTDRESVILAQLVKGESSKEVARVLSISPRTVDFHRANMMHKLGAKNAAELIAKALAGN